MKSWTPPLTANAWLRWEVVARRLPVPPASVLEIGSGQGGFGARLAGRYRYVGVEPDWRSYAVASRRIAAQGTVHHGTLEVLQPHERFDLVCAFEVLEHVEDERQELASWYDPVLPGGLMVLSVPAWQHRFAAADEMVGHYRRYDPEHLARLLRDVGLEEVRVEQYGAPVGFLLEWIRNAMGRAARGRVRGESKQARSARSGRLLPPREGVIAASVYLIMLPFRKLQLLFPNRGPGLVAVGRRPADDRS